MHARHTLPKPTLDHYDLLPQWKEYESLPDVNFVRPESALKHSDSDAPIPCRKRKRKAMPRPEELNRTIDAEYVEEKSDALVHTGPLDLSPLAPIMDVDTAMQRLAVFRDFIDRCMVEGEDYGRAFPEQQKPSLFKAGADKLCELYGLSDDYEEIRSEIDWENGLFDYELRCILSKGSRRVSTGLGCCSSFESKYRWRDAARKCPHCGAAAIIRGRPEYADENDPGGGWVCFRKKGGCGKKFLTTDPVITTQPVGRVKNDDIVDLKNTVLKMAKKRAKIDATLAATRSSGIFTQDESEEGAEAEPAAEKKTAADKKKTAAQKQDATQSDDGYISEGDRRAIFAGASRAKVDHEHLKAYLLNIHNVDSTAKMSRAVADDVHQWLKDIEQIASLASHAGVPLEDVALYLKEQHSVMDGIPPSRNIATLTLGWLDSIQKSLSETAAKEAGS